jgi:hypothetical protein
VTHPDHHAGDGCAAAITAAHEALADVLQRVEQQLAAVAELLQQRPAGIEAGGMGFQAERVDATQYEARPQVDLRSVL